MARGTWNETPVSPFPQAKRAQKEQNCPESNFANSGKQNDQKLKKNEDIQDNARSSKYTLPTGTVDCILQDGFIKVHCLKISSFRF